MWSCRCSCRWRLRLRCCSPAVASPLAEPCPPGGAPVRIYSTQKTQREYRVNMPSKHHTLDIYMLFSHQRTTVSPEGHTAEKTDMKSDMKSETQIKLRSQFGRNVKLVSEWHQSCLLYSLLNCWLICLYLRMCCSQLHVISLVCFLHSHCGFKTFWFGYLDQWICCVIMMMIFSGGK